MHLDVVELRQFYATPLGAVTRRMLGHRVRARWRQARGLSVVGLGYALPYIGAYQGEARMVGALMPAEQGALVWPPNAPTRTVMVDEEQLPLADNSVDRLLAIHCLEAVGGRAQVLLREMWRVLAPEGRLLLIVPNRRGLWARRDVTPFGHGQPYSRAQLERLLRGAMFSPMEWGTALHMPPIDRRPILRSAVAFERVGSRLWPTFAGVVMVEARKELTAPIGRVAVARRPQPAIAGAQP